MGKDPAVLWYFGDWNSGTGLMSRFLKGCYMDLLHAQFNNGHLSLEEIKICLGSDFGQSWPTLQKKFEIDPNGLFFNERLEQEKLKRIAFCESRKNGKAGKKKSYDKSHDNHMANHMNNHTENENVTVFIGKGVVGEKPKPVDESGTIFKIEDCISIALFDERWVRASGATKDKLFEFNRFLESQSEYTKNPADYKKHFSNWWKKNGSSKESFGSGTDKKMVI